MKPTFTFIALLWASICLAQAPNKISYQSVVRNSSNALVQNSNVGIKISILKGASTGTTIYSESQTPTTNTNGLVSIVIGNGNVISGSMDINWNDDQYYIKTEVDATGGASYTLSNTTQLLSVPYAFYANNAGSLEYPDGNSGESVLISSSSSYTVPAGKNLILNNAQGGIKIGSVSFDVSYPPMLIIGPGQTVSTIGSNGFASGFVTNAHVTALVANLQTGNYVVPSGKTLVLYGTNEENAYPKTFRINNVNPNPNGASDFPSRPIILSSGTILSGQCLINGYLK